VKALKQENSVCHSMVHLNRKMVGLLALRNPKISTNCKAPVYGGDSACPPEPPLRFAIVSYYLSLELSLPVPQRRGRMYYMPLPP